MNGWRFAIVFLLLTVAQCVVGAGVFLSPYVMLSILPLLILAVPVRRGTISLMFIAFATGFAVDFFTDGALGLSSAALLCVVLVKKPVIDFLGSEDAVTRKDFSPMVRFTSLQCAMCLATASLIYFCIYVWLDGAAMRPLWFNLARIGGSTVASTVLGLIVWKFIFFNSDQRWK